MDFFIQLVLAGLSIGAVYALVGLGLNLTFWTTRVLNFGQGSVMMAGAMITAMLVLNGVQVFIALAAALLFTGGCLWIIEFIGVRPMLKDGMGSMGWVVSTLGAGVFLQGVASLLFGTQAVPFPDVIFSSSDNIEFFGAYLSVQYLAVFLISIFLVLLLEFMLRRTNWGYSVRAVAHDPELSSTMGIRVRRVVITSFFLSGILAGAAGILVSQVSGTVDPNFGLHLLILSFVAAVIGGLGSAWGSLVGGLFLGVLENLVSGYVAPAAAQVIAFVLLVGVLTIRPQGLFGKEEVVKV